MKFQRAYVLLVLGALLTSCENPPQEPKVEKARHPLVDTVRSATSVVAHRLEKIESSSGARSYFVRPEGVQLDPKQQSDLASAVESIDFDPEQMNLCIFDPAIEYRFSGAGNMTRLRVCFSCSDVMFVGDGDAALSKKVGFSRATEVELLRSAKALFPSDLGIQARK